MANKKEGKEHRGRAGGGVLWPLKPKPEGLVASILEVCRMLVSRVDFVDRCLLKRTRPPPNVNRLNAFRVIAAGLYTR